MKWRLNSILILGLLVFLPACESRTDKTDGGGVLLSVQDFDGLPISVSVNSAMTVGFVTIDEITIESVVKDPGGSSGNLQNVEMDSYEVTFTRGDGGTRLPPPLVQDIFGVTPVGGTNTYENLPILTTAQLENVPLSDLLVLNGGFDSETGRTSISLNFALRFFGRTLSGDEVESAPARFTVEFVP